jgi:hypothetical protein
MPDIRGARPKREFCEAHGISVSTYDHLPKELRPREIRIGDHRGAKILISDEAAADWRRMMEQRTAEIAAANSEAA